MIVRRKFLTQLGAGVAAIVVPANHLYAGRCKRRLRRPRNNVLQGAKNLMDSLVLDGVYLRLSLTSSQRDTNQKFLHHHFLLKKTGRKLQVWYSGDGDPYLWDSVVKRMEDTNQSLLGDGINPVFDDIIGGARSSTPFV